jgi:hypothetical protein
MRAPPAGMRAPPASTHETIKKSKKILKILFMFYACISLQNMQKICIAIHFCFPFIEGKCLFLTLH